jgi:hypothetical protein
MLSADELRSYARGKGYVEWRRAWFVLDRHANEAGRRRRVEEALAEADVTG